MKSFLQFVTESVDLDKLIQIGLKIYKETGDCSTYFDLDGNLKNFDEIKEIPCILISVLNSNNKPKYAISFYDIPGKLHRLDGPASIQKNSAKKIKEFWIHGKRFTEEDYWEQPEVILYKLGGQDALNILDI